MVVSDLIKTTLALQDYSEWYFWASPSGPEVDLLRRRGETLSAYEIKSGMTFRPRDPANLQRWAGVRIRPWWSVGPALQKR